MPPAEHDTAASRRESLEAAFDQFEEQEPAPATPPVEEEEIEEETEDEEVETEEETEEDGDSEGDGESEDTEEEESDEEEQSENETALKPPASWGPKAKADWKKVPAHLQAEITRRERDYSVGIQKNAESAKLGENIKNVLAPYASFMAAEGADEVEAVKNLAQHAGIMRMGTNLQKAQTVAQIISQYGVDIQMLDSMLAGEEVDESTHQINQVLEQRLKPIETMLQQGQQTAAQSIQAAQAREIDQFANDATNEFFEDVREQMADIIELKGQQGKDCTLKQAYDIAVSMNPEIQEILADRKKKERLTNNKVNLQNKSNAASSVRNSQQSGPGTEQKPDSLRGQLLDAWDNVEGDTGGRI